MKGNSVFKEWTRSWARREIIQSAVRVIHPRPTEEHAPTSSGTSNKIWRQNPQNLQRFSCSTHSSALSMSCRCSNTTPTALTIAAFATTAPGTLVEERIVDTVLGASIAFVVLWTTDWVCKRHRASALRHSYRRRLLLGWMPNRTTIRKC